MNKGSAFGIGLGVGVVLGAILGLLFAPKSGKETRQLIAEKAKAIKSKITKKNK